MGEISWRFVTAFSPTCLLGVSAQGWLRGYRKNRVYMRRWPHPERVLGRCRFLFFSEEDVGCKESLVEEYASLAPTTCVTRGAKGVTVFNRGRRCDYPAFAANEWDATGAGDVFAAAFLLRYRETGDLEDACRYGQCAAAISVEHPGTSGIPSRQQVEHRLEQKR